MGEIQVAPAAWVSPVGVSCAMKRFLLAASAALAGCLAACQSDSKPGTITQRPDQPAADQPTLPAGRAGASYRIYRGLLPGSTDSITLHLLIAPRHANDTEMAGVFGSYHGSDGQPFLLTGEPNANPDSVVLSDSSPEKLAPDTYIGPRWALRRVGAELRGTYAGQPLQLRERRPPGSLPLAVQHFADSVAAFPELPNSPYGQVSLQALVPANAALATNILRDLRGDTLPRQPVPALAQLWQQQRADFQKTYREDAADSRPAPEDSVDGPFGYGLRHEQQQATFVLWNQAPLLSLGYFSFNFSGGAHGIYYTNVVSYDTRNGQPLRFADIFRPGSEAKLSPLLDHAVRRTLRIKADEPLEETLFVKTMPVTKNVYLTSGGAVFVYAPYEIASYAQGEIQVFVPLTQLRPLLKAPAAVI